MTFDVALDLENNERLPVKNLTLRINATKTCTFGVDGAPLEGCSNIQIMPLVTGVLGFGYLNGYGISSTGLNFTNQSREFGYGYGYGYVSGKHGFNAELSYQIKWNTTADGTADGSYAANLEANTYANGNNVLFKKKEDVNFIIEKAAVGCFTKLSDVPVTCSQGAKIMDMFLDSCRKITCKSNDDETRVLACEKPNEASLKTHYEVYRQVQVGKKIEVCVGNSCVNGNGFAKSESFPVCTGGATLPTSAALSIKKWYPKGLEHVFLCDPAGFTPTAYDWDFGDGSTQTDSSNMDVFHTFASPGNYTVKCTAKNAIVSKMATLNVTAKASKTAALTIKKWFPQGRNYVFVCTANGFTPTSYDWYFGDGQKQLSSSNKDVWHTYSSAGPKTVKCVAKDAANTQESTLPVIVS